MLKQRIVTALILAVLAILALFKAPDLIWQWIMLTVVAVGAWEWAGFAGLERKRDRGIFALSTPVLAAVALQLLDLRAVYVMTLLELVMLGYLVVRYQLSKGTCRLRSTLWILLAGWLFMVLFAVVMVRFRLEFSAQWLLLSMAVIWAMDTGAYFSGRRFGKHKLASYVSPGKTWEGVWGGMLLAFLLSLGFLSWLQPELSIPVWSFALFSALIALVSVMGDLFESVLKRQVGMKDSGRILPGHGGVLDRIDSLLIAVPLFYLLWTLGSQG